MSDSPLSAQDIRATVEVHRELGPDYGDAVVESFLAKIDKHIEERVEQRLASARRLSRRPIDPARLSKYRTALTGAAIGAVVAGAPLSFAAWWVLKDAGGNPAPLVVIWVVLLAVYGLAAYRLRRR
ncbi:MAG TPA: hypothetical protein VMA72_07470 [Streptosporangiaceae bacterium]|nr:hypothetical protein [Streptosporangiaceae bacterium]